MRTPKPPVAALVLGLLVVLVPLDWPAGVVGGQSRVELAVAPAAMGDYEVVANWPKPLPDKDLPHDGWTWGSGAGVFAESPDKVWVAQRSEIQLPPGATPWICPCLLTPRRTNTGRRAYSGKDYPYEQRRHHLVFAVDRDGNTIEEWLQHDRLLAPPRGSGLGEAGRGPHKVLISPYDPEKHVWIVDDDQHIINIFTNDGRLVRDDGRARRARAGAEQLQPAHRHRLAARRDVLRADGYAGTRVAKFDRTASS